MKHILFPLAAMLALAAPLPAEAQEPPRYQTPPEPIRRILDTPPQPLVSVSPDRSAMALLGRANLPPIAELAEPDLKLAGYRINPRNKGPANSRIQWLTSLSIQPVDGGPARSVAIPTVTRFFNPVWSPDGSHLAILAEGRTDLDLWVIEARTGRARRLRAPAVNATLPNAVGWLPDSSGLLVRLAVPVPVEAGTVNVPTGPTIQENAGRVAPVRTYQDLLRSPADERLFDRYFTSQLAVVHLDNRLPRRIGQPGVIWNTSVSPDGRFVLQNRVKRPYSYNVPATLFPTEVLVTDLDGRVVRRAADLPLRDDIPSPFDAVPLGPRDVHWRADAPATLAWTEAQDGGDPRRPAPVRDRVFLQDAPFTAAPRALVDLPERYDRIEWGRPDFAVVYSATYNSRNETRTAVNPSAPGGAGRPLLTRNFQDRYNDPGAPILRINEQGRRVLHFTPDGGGVFTTAQGAGAEGDFPFLARMNIADGRSERLWQAQAPAYESVVALVDDEGRQMLTLRETRTDPGNYFLRDRTAPDARPAQLTRFSDPAPQFAGVTQRLLTYARPDGVKLSGALYLPAGYDPQRDGPLPLVMWAYPAEFTDAAVAGQVNNRSNRFVRPAGASHLFLVTQGYAVLDNPTMPIIGLNGAEPNDTYVQQLQANAQAAVDEVVRLGVADRSRIAVGGHSYGAFMTANLLAHTDLFRTGIARSGAYNRTLTPFGFQAEQRTYWEAPATYQVMSPFTHVPKIKEPILLIHGEADDNQGTFPVQTERFYAALKGNGATARYVVLPLEAHGYRGRESVMHTLWEMVSWLDKHVKAAPAAPVQPAPARPVG
jgi:dipeptidyl aminopeptidase/acylaminoacyl peptidase